MFRYEARVAARNQYGLSKFSKPFLFATKGAGIYMILLKQNLNYIGMFFNPFN